MAEQTASRQDDPKAAPLPPTPQPQPVTVVSIVPPPVVATAGLDTAPAGGRYRVGDQLVDANGKPLQDPK